MKKILLAASLLTSILNTAQTTLTQSFNEPKSGDLETNFPLDTSGFTTGLPLNVTGNTAVWDFTKLKAVNMPLETYYLSPSSVPSSSNYPGCTFVQDSDGAYTYYKSVTAPTQQTEILGLSINTFSASFNFSNSAILTKYPLAFGSSSTDNISGAFTASVTGTCAGNINTTADGLGTLNLPEGYTLTNVLRVKSVQTLTLSAVVSTLFPIPVSVGSVKQTVYRYYHFSQKFPILSVNYQALSFISSSTPTITGFATGNVDYFVTGINESKLNADDVLIYPNPSNSHFNMNVNNGNHEKCKVEIFKVTGELIKSVDLGNEASIEKTISLEHVKSGIYLIKTSQGSKSLTKKLVVE